MALLKGVDSPPSRQALHLVADFAELMCAASIDGEYSTSDFRAIRKKQASDDSTPLEVSDRELMLEADDAEVDPLTLANLDVADEGADLEEEPAPAEIDDEAEPNTASGPAADDDGRTVESSDLVQHLEYRAQAFGDAYPFAIRDDDNIQLEGELTDLRRAYLFLLLASSLSKLADKKNEDPITDAFEYLCRAALQAHLGSRFQVHVFGTSSRDGVDRYTGTLWDRLEVLEKDLRVKVVADEEEVRTNLKGDNGLDIVAWAEMGDDAVGLIAVFLQCACGRSWKRKQDEASEPKWRRVLQFAAPLVSGILIPYCYRNIDGSWYVDYQLAHGVLMDRVRLITALALSAEHAEQAVADLPADLLQGVLDEELT